MEHGGTQLTILNERIRMYAGRLWQLPVIYVSAVAVSFSMLGSHDQIRLMFCCCIFYLIFGSAVIWLLCIYRRRINELVYKTKKLEHAIELGPFSSVARFDMKMLVPYLMITLIGMGLCAMRLVWG